MSIVDRQPSVWRGDDALKSVRSITSEGDLVRLISSTLRERETDSISRSVRVLGMEACAELLVATIHQENEGGLKTSDGARRRTPGGTFFELMRKIASKAQYREIFAEKTRAKNALRNAKKNKEKSSGMSVERNRTSFLR